LWHARPFDSPAGLCAAILGTAWEGCCRAAAWTRSLRLGHSLDGVHRRARFHHAGKYSKLADLILHEELRQGVACTEWLHRIWLSVPWSDVSRDPYCRHRTRRILHAAME